MDLEILSTEIIDNANEINEPISDDEYDSYYQPSEISVLVEIEIDGKEYFLDFQTTTTSDYGAYSSDLHPYDDGDYDKISELFDDGTDDDGFHKLIQDIKEKSSVDELWQEYVEENYIVDGSHFGGMDANSEVNRMTKR